MSRNKHILLALTLAFFWGCTSTSNLLEPDGGQWNLNVSVCDILEDGLRTTKTSYSGEYGNHTEFETGDSFGLFVLNEGTIKKSNLKVYCSGFDNRGKSVWSIFKEGEDGKTSNYPLSDILAEGSQYFAYFPYDAAHTSIATLDGLKSFVSGFADQLPSDQSSSFSDNDLLVASNIPGCKYGSITISGEEVTISLSHTMAMLRYLLPAGAVKYAYLFNGADFNPYKLQTIGDEDEYRFIFKPGCILDISIKYVHKGKLYKLETGNRKNLFPITTKPGYNYYLDKNAPLVPYSTAVDMGTSVMWCSFNLGAELDKSATKENLSSLIGTPVMWAVNIVTASYGATSYNSYNKAFQEGTAPSSLPIGYCFSGEKKYDAATNLWGGKWRIPTSEEWAELFDACTYNITPNKMICFTSKTTRNTIEIPYGGYYNSSTASATSSGFYWSSSSSPTEINKAKAANFDTTIKQIDKADRYTGVPVRPVYTP